MNLEHEQGIKAFEHCLSWLCGRSMSEMHFELAGIMSKDLEAFRNGTTYMTEEQFYAFARILRAPMFLEKPLIQWLNLGDHWALVGILQPTFSLNGQPVRAILDLPYAIINNPDIKFHIGDSLMHTCPNGLQEELFITDFEYSFVPKGYKPTYLLTVTRSKQDMHNTNNFHFGDNTQIGGNARFNTGNVIDKSNNEIHELPADFFEQTRALLADVNNEHRLELEKMLAKIETTHAIGNKKECGNWFGQFFSLASIADCITVAQPLLPLISWICKN